MVVRNQLHGNSHGCKENRDWIKEKQKVQFALFRVLRRTFWKTMTGLMIILWSLVVLVFFKVIQIMPQM